MLDGAPSLGQLEGVTWYTPQEIEAIRNRELVRQRLDRRGDDLGFKAPDPRTFENILRRVKR
jgi:hypothetical protein